MASYTPAPWRVLGHTRFDKHIDIHGNGSCCRDLVCEVYSDDIDHAMAEANARLVAAAPALYEALRLMLASQDCAWEERNLGHDWVDACRQARDALAAAVALPPIGEKEG